MLDSQTFLYGIRKMFTCDSECLGAIKLKLINN